MAFINQQETNKQNRGGHLLRIYAPENILKVTHNMEICDEHRRFRNVFFFVKKSIDKASEDEKDAWEDCHLFDMGLGKGLIYVRSLICRLKRENTGTFAATLSKDVNGD